LHLYYIVIILLGIKERTFKHQWLCLCNANERPVAAARAFKLVGLASSG
jgi:hypothetical protein